jgi:uncharacterized protein (DUF1778 family)
MEYKICTVRMRREIAELIDRIAAQRGEDFSSFVRRAAMKELAQLGCLPDEYRKALGI